MFYSCFSTICFIVRKLFFEINKNKNEIKKCFLTFRFFPIESFIFAPRIENIC